MKLGEFLADKPLALAHFDPERMPKAWEEVAPSITLPPCVRLIGTNGKGSTGRFLAEILHHSGFNVGHYTSPHIHTLNERFWCSGEHVTDHALEEAHTKLLSLLPPHTPNTLSYFEYTTMLAAVIFEGCDYMVIETGLGGEYDATSIFNPELLIVTPIEYDHMDFLGENIEAIASTKLRAMHSTTLLGFQTRGEVYDIAAEIALERGYELIDLRNLHPEGEGLGYLEQNRLLANSAAGFLGIESPEMVEINGALFGRLTRIAPNIVIDVGHNPAAARRIKEQLSNHLITLIYNTLEDKDYPQILRILQPNLKHVMILPIEDERALATQDLHAVLDALQIPHGPMEALSDEENYLVFGSFKTVSAFLTEYHAH